jgi:hypothetical protein
MSKWSDTTSYSQSDKERIPAQFTLTLKSIRITVHRNIHYPKDQWLLSCHRLKIDNFELKNKDIEKAKDEALTEILNVVHYMYCELKDAINGVEK